MEPRTIAQAMAIGRVAFGVGFVAAPGPTAAGWVGRDARRAGTKVFVTGLGARDVALGAGILNALRSGGARPWLAAAAACDVGDLVATLRARDDIPRFGVAALTLVAGGAAAVGAWLVAQEDW